MIALVVDFLKTCALFSVLYSKLNFFITYPSNVFKQTRISPKLSF